MRKLNRKKIIILGITTIFLLIIATLGFAYGYYNSFVLKLEQSKKITVTSGTSEITYVASLIDDDSIETIKPGFTSVDYFAAQNTGETNAMYFIYLENVINTFINTEDITYSIYRTKGTDSINFDYIDVSTFDYTTWEVIVNNEIYPTNDTLLKDTKETILNKNEYYIYAIVINYKYRLDKDQSVDSEHIFGGQIKLIPTDIVDTTNPYDKTTLAYEIINNSILNINGTKYNTAPLTSIIEDNSKQAFLSVAEDNYGLSYYYRGNVQDNFINFNNMCFRIVRIEGDGSIKISLYDNNSTCNESIKDNNYPLIKEEENVIKKLYLDDIKGELDNWYNMKDFTAVEKKLKLDNWCTLNKNNKYSSIDNTLIENLDIYAIQNKDEYGNFTYNYNTKKSFEEKNPTLKCNEINNAYKSYVGLLTAEEILLNNNNGGIDTNEYNVTTLTLSKYDSKDNLDYVYTYKLNEIATNEALAINPTITLLTGAEYLKGNGTINNAYEIK